MFELFPVPTITTITVQRPSHEPNVCDVHGGSLVAIVGTGFIAPVEVRIQVAGEYVSDLEGKIARGYIWDPLRNMTRTLIYAGMPALSAGAYDVSIVTDGGASNVVSVTYRLFAEEHRVLSVRQKFAKTWRTGSRFLRR
jgi:hypothetical protein